jgi:hypothetical protein
MDSTSPPPEKIRQANITAVGQVSPTTKLAARLPGTQMFFCRATIIQLIRNFRIFFVARQ